MAGFMWDGDHGTVTKKELLESVLINELHTFGAVFVTKYDKRKEAGYWLYNGFCEDCAPEGLLKFTPTLRDEKQVYDLTMQHLDEFHPDWSPIKAAAKGP